MVADKSTVVRSRGVERGVWQGNGRLNLARAVGGRIGRLTSLHSPGLYDSSAGEIQFRNRCGPDHEWEFLIDGITDACKYCCVIRKFAF